MGAPTRQLSSGKTSTVPLDFFGFEKRASPALYPLGTDIGSLGAADRQRFGPTPGWHAVSINRLYDREGLYRHFLAYYEPVDRVGSSIFVYYITVEEANRVRREYGLSPLGSDSLSTR